MPRVARVFKRDPTQHAGEGPAAANSSALRYHAFLSYSHTDAETAKWLQDGVERFTIPQSLVGRITGNGPVPARLSPIFRDRHELAASTDLAAEIREALHSSRFLIVLCSPAAAKSRWTNAEIDMFKRHRPDGCVFAAIVDGEPFASEIPGREEEECLPPALRVRYDRRGRPTTKRTEPLAADLREGRDGRRLGLLKIVAGMLDVGLDDLVQRDTQRRHRRLAWLSASSLAGMVLASGLAFAAFQARDEARDQRREAEGLVGFMLGDLRDKLEPIGRLDALDAVGARALDYYSGQDKTALSDASLAQRAKALALMGQIATARGDLDGAFKRYGEALASTGELLRREPANAERMFDHAQNVFWVGQVASLQGNTAGAERAWSEYKRLADRMLATDPANPKWRMETQYANANLGIVKYKQRRYPEAAALFERALSTIEAVAAAEPGNRDHQLSLALSLAWLADARRAEGRLAEAIAQRERQIAVLQRPLRAGVRDVAFREALIPAHEALGRLLGSHGELKAAEAALRRAIEEADRLIATEPENMQWRSMAASSRIGLAEVLLASRQTEAAAAAVRAGCDDASRLSRGTGNSERWHHLLGQCLLVRAHLALASGSNGEALELGFQALAAIQRTGMINRQEAAFAAASARRLIGDVHSRIGSPAAAVNQWRAGLATLPPAAADRPLELSERVELLRRLGRADEARAGAARLSAMGFQRLY